MMSRSNPTEDYDLINLVCPEGLEGHVRCLLGLAGGVKNLQVLRLFDVLVLWKSGQTVE